MVDYLSLQQKLQTRQTYRAWWVFWANFSALPIILIYISYYQPGAIEALALILAALTIRFVVVSLINYLYPVKRPYQANNFTPIKTWFTSEHLKGPTSFPSAHMSFLTVVFSVWLFNALFTPEQGHNSLQQWLGLNLVLVCLGLTAAGRVILGYHFVRDVIGGFLLSLFLGPLFWVFFSYLSALIFL